MNSDLTAQMLDVLDRIGSRASTATELGANGYTLRRMAARDLVYVDEGDPPLFSLTARGAAMAELMKAPVTFVPSDGPIAKIQRVVAHHFKVPLPEMWSERRSRGVARPRQVAMYFARELTPLSLPSIGRRFGKRDHTTIMHGISKVEQLISEGGELAGHVEAIRATLSTELAKVGDLSSIPSVSNELVGA